MERDNSCRVKIKKGWIEVRVRLDGDTRGGDVKLSRGQILKWFPARKEAIPFAKIVSYIYCKNSFTEDILRKFSARRVTSPRQDLHPDKTYPGISI